MQSLETQTGERKKASVHCMSMDLSPPIQRQPNLRYLLPDKGTPDRFQLFTLGSLLIGEGAHHITRVVHLCEAMSLCEDRVRLLLHRLKHDLRTPEMVMERCATVLRWSDGRSNRPIAPSGSRRSRAQNRQIHRDTSTQNRQIHRDSTHPTYMLENRARESSTHEGAPQARQSTFQQQVTNRAGQSNAPADIVSRVWVERGLPEVDRDSRVRVNHQLRNEPIENIEAAARYFAADRTAVETAISREALFLHSWHYYVAAWQKGEQEGWRVMPYPPKRPRLAVNDWQRTHDQGATSVAPSRRVVPVAPVAPVAPSRRVLHQKWRREILKIVANRDPAKVEHVPVVLECNDVENELHEFAQAAYLFCVANFGREGYPEQVGRNGSLHMLDVIELLGKLRVNEDEQDDATSPD